MKIIYFFLFSMAILFSSCDNNDIPNVYFPGVIKIRANNDFRNGMIESLDVFSSDEDIETLSRAIIYVHEKNYPYFDLNDTVYYKIKCENGILIAYDIHKNDLYTGSYIKSEGQKVFNVKKMFGSRKVFGEVFINDQDPRESGDYYFQIDARGPFNFKKLTADIFASKDEVYSIRNNYKLNLHAADDHREGPQHKIRHIKPPKYSYPLGTSAPNRLELEQYKAIKLYDDQSDTLYAFVFDPNNVSEDSSIDYFLYEKTAPDNFDETHFNDISQYLDFIRDIKFYDISTSHDHTLE